MQNTFFALKTKILTKIAPSASGALISGIENIVMANNPFSLLGSNIGVGVSNIE